MMFEQGHAAAAPAGEGGFDAGEVIIGHVSNTSHEHPLIHLPSLFGIDMSVTKHVFMLWVVAAALFVIVTSVVRRYVKGGRLVPGKGATLLEVIVDFVRDGIVRPNIG